MTAQVEAPANHRNLLADSFHIAFQLSPAEIEAIVAECHEALITHRDEIVIKPKRITPSTKGMSFEEKQSIRAEVDAENTVRAQRVYSFFRSFLSEESSQLLAGRLKSTVEGFVVRHCPGDAYFTLIVDHS